jgi:hypothetical protein
MSNVETIKTWVSKLARPLIVKWITRLVTYGTATALWKNLFGEIDAGQSTSAVEWIVTGAMTALALGIDYLHNRYTKNNVAALTTIVAAVEEVKDSDPSAAQAVTDQVKIEADAAGTTDITRKAVNAVKPTP